jgi:hypothetical protein
VKKRLIITEDQLKVIAEFLVEGSDYSIIVKEIEKDLNSNYRKAIETYRDGNEYKQREIFEIIVDGQLISPEKLLEYFKLKYPYGVKFLKQVIMDWCDGNINDGTLSRNIGLTE